MSLPLALQPALSLYYSFARMSREIERNAPASAEIRSGVAPFRSSFFYWFALPLFGGGIVRSKLVQSGSTRASRIDEEGRVFTVCLQQGRDEGSWRKRMEMDWEICGRTRSSGDESEQSEVAVERYSRVDRGEGGLLADRIVRLFTLFSIFFVYVLRLLLITATVPFFRS